MNDNVLMYRLGNTSLFLLLVFLLSFGLMALWQYKRGFRKPPASLKERWKNHLGLAFIDLLVLRLIFSMPFLWAAALGARLHWGLFNWMEMPILFSLPFTVVVLDWMTYYLHRMYHAIPFLWNIHRVHHTDMEVETSTGVRFHPLEELMTSLWKGLFILGLGAPLLGVLAYEALRLTANLFNHTNARLPNHLEPWVRLLVVTPDMHRVHHSREPKETNSNFGFILSFWDRVLMTYRADSNKGQEGLILGLDYHRAPQDQSLTELLKQPFLGARGQFSWSNLWHKERNP